jgi:hypothetical protein
MPSAFKDIISQLQRQKIAIERALAALQEVGDTGFEEAEPPRPSTKEAAKKATTKKAAAKRTLSPEARKRISDAVKKRWAATKRPAKKSSAKKAA